jgi:hypothetical protein
VTLLLGYQAASPIQSPIHRRIPHLAPGTPSLSIAIYRHPAIDLALRDKIQVDEACTAFKYLLPIHPFLCTKTPPSFCVTAPNNLLTVIAVTMQ